MEKHCYMKIVLFVIITGPIVAFEIIDRVHSPLLPGGWQREKTFFYILTDLNGPLWCRRDWSDKLWRQVFPFNFNCVEVKVKVE